jgi:hypothetical protein
MQALYKGGPRVLFIGIESFNWNANQFVQAAQFAKQHGLTGVALKVAEGSNLWYSGYNGIAQHISDMEKQGIKVLPYCYSYAQYVQAEIPIYIELMKRFGGVILDMESEYNGQVQAAEAINAALKPIPGYTYITTWADPDLQNWRGVMSALNPCTNAWIPQAYDNFLQSTMDTEFAGGNFYPAIDLSAEFGANDAVGIARDAQSRKDQAIFIWEYQMAVSNPTLLANIVKAFPGQTSTPAPNPNIDERKVFEKEWTAIQPTASTTSGIAQKPRPGTDAGN